MPVNTLKALTERMDAKAAECRTLGQACKEHATEGTPEMRTAFDTAFKELEELRSQVARAKKFEDLESSVGGDTRNAGPNGEQLGEMTPEEKRGDVLNPADFPDEKGYRIGKVLDARMEGRALDGVEAEVHSELEKRSGTPSKGFAIPMALQIRAIAGFAAKRMMDAAGLGEKEKRELNLAGGSAALPTVLGNNLIDFLKNVAIGPQAGVTVLSGLEGIFEMPKVDGIPVFSWGGESFTPAESTGTINSKVTFTPKTLSGRSKLTRRFIKQSLHSLDAEMWIRQQLMTYHALGLDWALFNGTGVGANPLGLLNNPAVQTLAMGVNGGSITFGKMVDMETAVADQNADSLGDGCYVTNARVRGLAKQTLKFPSAGSATIWENGSINGHSAKMSNQIPKNFTKGTGTNLSAMAYGIFSQLMIGLWSGADMLADPYTDGGSGGMNVYLHQEADIQNRHDEAFVKATDIDAQI